MRARTMRGTLGAAIAVLGMLSTTAPDPATASTRAYPTAPAALQEESRPRFVGAKLCKTCHFVPTTGRQYKIWKEKDPHSNAAKALSSDRAKEIAAQKGIADPETALECLACHESDGGVDTDQRGELYLKNEGVGCEGCHGAGEYFAKEEIWEQPRDVWLAAGLIPGSFEDCARCHDETSPRAMHPRIAEGEFESAKAFEPIAHPIPEEGLEEASG